MDFPKKNISSSKLIEAYVKVINETKDVDKEVIKSKLQKDNAYKGRSNQGSLSTMGGFALVKCAFICLVIRVVIQYLFHLKPQLIRLIKQV